MKTKHPSPPSAAPLAPRSAGVHRGVLPHIHRRPEHTPAKRGANGRAAFSFAEVMFAVVILGIGFIMVAAVFPVAIQQTQTTGEESTAAEIARNAVDDMRNLPATVVDPNYPTATYPLVGTATAQQSVKTWLMLPPTVKNYVKGTDIYAVAPPAVFVPFVGDRWNALRGNIISATDPRYSYVALYRREANATGIQVIIVSVANRVRTIYDPAVDIVSTEPFGSNTTSTTAAFSPIATIAASAQTQIRPDTISIGGSYIYPQEGFSFTTSLPVLPSSIPGNRTYRLGRQISSLGGIVNYGPGVFEIDAGDTLELTAGTNGWGSQGTISGTPPVNSRTDDAPGVIAGTVYPNATLQPTVAYAAIRADSSNPSGQIQLISAPASGFTPFSIAGTAGTAAPANAATGAFVIVADDFPYDPTSANTLADQAPAGFVGYSLPDNIQSTTVGAPPWFAVGALNGRIFRLGQPLTKDSQGNQLPQGVYNLDPSYGIRPQAAGDASPSPDVVPNYHLQLLGAPAPLAKVFIVGMGRDNTARELGGPTGTNGPTYSKGAQDIGVFTTYIPVQQ